MAEGRADEFRIMVNPFACDMLAIDPSMRNDHIEKISATDGSH
jgi:hypothetical protein